MQTNFSQRKTGTYIRRIIHLMLGLLLSYHIGISKVNWYGYYEGEGDYFALPAEQFYMGYH